MTSTRLLGLAIAVSALALVSATTACSSPAGHPAATGSPATAPTSPATAPTSPAATHAPVGGTPTTATVSPNVVTKGDAEALLGGFLIACQDPATYPLAGQGVPCAKVERGRIYDVDGHYCADDWHLVSSQLVDTRANLQKYEPQQSIDGVILQTTRTPIRLIDSAYSQQQFGGQYYYIQIGVVLPPRQISAGRHSLRQFTTGGGFDRQIPFTIDRSGTGVCAGR
jgi:hypothetical protein